MGTKTVDETGVKTDDEKTVKAEQEAATDQTVGEAGEAEDAAADTDDDTAPQAAAGGAVEKEGSTGVGQGAAAVVSAGLGIVSLTGSWVGTVASARESLIGQLETSSSSNVGTLIEKGYGDAWHATALWGGAFALVALIVGVVVLARPAFGAPGRPQAPGSSRSPGRASPSASSACCSRS